MTRLSGPEIERLVDKVADPYSGDRKRHKDELRKVLQDAYLEADQSHQLHEMLMASARERVQLEFQIESLQARLGKSEDNILLPLCARCLEEKVMHPNSAIAIRGGRSWCNMHFGRVEENQNHQKEG